MQFLEPAESAGQSQRVTEIMLKGSGRASLNVEDEAISTSPHPPPSPREIFSSYPSIEDETYSSNPSSFIPYGSPGSEATQLTNQGFLEETSDGVFYRYQCAESASIAIKDTNEPTLAVTLPPKVSYTPLAQTNSIGDFVTDESVSSAPSTSENEEPDEGNALSFSFKKQELLQTLMKIFYTQLSSSWRYTAKGSVTSVGATESTRSSGSSAGQESTSLSRDKTERPALKRRADEDGLPPGDGGDEDGRRKRRLKSPEPQIYSNTRKFACPFFKYDPNRYCSVGSCIGPGFTSVSRVKFVLPYPYRTRDFGS